MVCYHSVQCLLPLFVSLVFVSNMDLLKKHCHLDYEISGFFPLKLTTCNDNNLCVNKHYCVICIKPVNSYYNEHISVLKIGGVKKKPTVSFGIL